MRGLVFLGNSCGALRDFIENKINLCCAFLRDSSVFLLSVFVLLLGGQVVQAASCTLAEPHAATGAEVALLSEAYGAAEGMYRAELTGKAGDETATAGLVEALLGQDKVAEAELAVNEGIAKDAGSAVLLTARAEVQIREGMLSDAAASVDAAMKADPCSARVHTRYAEIYRLNSMYASAKRQIDLAYKLDPWDGEIHRAWVESLPLDERIAELEKELSGDAGSNVTATAQTRAYVEELKQRKAEAGKGCRLVGNVSTTELPFAPLMYDATHIRAYGLEVKLNDQTARLEIDTGASGLLVSRSVAQRAGLKRMSTDEVTGVGDEGAQKGYESYAESIKIGELEFRDCRVEVLGGKRLEDSDGLIGMDIFSNFLVTLNYPLHKVKLEPLPLRPGEVAAAHNLGTGGEMEEDSAGPQNRYISPEMKGYVPIFRRGHDLLVPVWLNKSKLKLFILDSGAWATTISLAAGKEVTKIHSEDSLEVKGLGGKVSKVFNADDVTFQFGDKAQRLVFVPSFDLTGTSRNLGIEVSGFLGARTLQLMTVHIDYRDGLVGFDYDSKTAGYLGQRLAR